MYSIDQVRGLFPDREFPTDEEIANTIAAREQAEAEAAQAQAEKESRKQSLRDQIANLQGELASIDGDQAQG